MAKEAMLKEMAKRKLRRVSGQHRTPESTDIAIGGSVIFYKKISREFPSKWRGPTNILDIGETEATEKFQKHPLEIARYCVRKRVAA